MSVQGTTKRFNRVHAVCASLRRKPCDQCPASESSDYGPVKNHCRLRAEEVANIARHGYPWRPPYNKRQLAWRKRWNCG